MRRQCRRVPVTRISFQIPTTKENCIMGYDIHGTEPTAPEGVHFRRSIWAWPPLTALCRELAPEVASKCKYWTSNDGDGLDADAAAQLAAHLQQLIADGTIAD